MSDVAAIKQRNARVEAEKAWETSWTRRIIIALLTYCVIGAYLTYLEIEKSHRRGEELQLAEAQSIMEKRASRIVSTIPKKSHCRSLLKFVRFHSEL